MKKYDKRIVVIVRETRLEKVLASQNTLSQAKFYINSLGGDFGEYEAEHQQYNASIQATRQEIESLGNIQLLDRKYLPNFIFAPDDVVVVIGQDGLVANTLKYLGDQPVIGVNPDAGRWDGVLLPFTPKDAAKIIRETLAGKRRIEEVSMAKARLQNGQELLAVNDFFIGQRTHVSAHYILKHDGLKEPQSSSGVIVSTGLGSTGWMKSVIAGAARISSSLIGHPYGAAQESERLMEVDEEDGVQYNMAALAATPLSSQEPDDAVAAGRPKEKTAPEPILRRIAAAPRKKTYGPSELSSVIGKWGSDELVFAVREPFPSKATGSNLVFGKILRNAPLRIESLMGENGVIFSDGMESDFLAFNSGAEAVIGLAEKRGHIVT
ncbi:MAG: sugar kinase [Candidatus Accumulibacter sp.]|jgi:NAD kinase|nr:sugar kinase [Accumulibacter sp.]